MACVADGAAVRVESARPIAPGMVAFAGTGAKML